MATWAPGAATPVAGTMVAGASAAGTDKTFTQVEYRNGWQHFAASRFSVCLNRSTRLKIRSARMPALPVHVLFQVPSEWERTLAPRGGDRAAGIRPQNRLPATVGHLPQAVEK